MKKNIERTLEDLPDTQGDKILEVSALICLQIAKILDNSGVKWSISAGIVSIAMSEFFGVLAANTGQSEKDLEEAIERLVINLRKNTKIFYERAISLKVNLDE